MIKKLAFLIFCLALGGAASAQDRAYQETKVQKAKPKVFVSGHSEKAAAQAQRVFDGAQPAEDAAAVNTESDQDKEAAGNLRKSEEENRSLEAELKQKKEQAVKLKGNIKSAARENADRMHYDRSFVRERDSLKRHQAVYREALAEEQHKQNQKTVAGFFFLTMGAVLFFGGMLASFVLPVGVAMGIGFGGLIGFTALGVGLLASAHRHDSAIEDYKEHVWRDENVIKELETRLGYDAQN